MTRKYISLCSCFYAFIWLEHPWKHVLFWHLILKSRYNAQVPVAVPRDEQEGERDVFVLGSRWTGHPLRPLLSSHLACFGASWLFWQFRPKMIVFALEQLELASCGSKWELKLTVNSRFAACFVPHVPPRFGSLAHAGKRELCWNCIWQQHFSLVAGITFYPVNCIFP